MEVKIITVTKRILTKFTSKITVQQLLGYFTKKDKDLIEDGIN